ncbi:unnamed protein product [Linum tenue]|uniref:Uncharacterized protein n=1 Tax=Linum tenue TaxID=586396 RepID=A0AAV0KFX0_9ROSI|nr:unnamed protein product [Linum tenue]
MFLSFVLYFFLQQLTKKNCSIMSQNLATLQILLLCSCFFLMFFLFSASK